MNVKDCTGLMCILEAISLVTNEPAHVGGFEDKDTYVWIRLSFKIPKE